MGARLPLDAMDRQGAGQTGAARIRAAAGRRRWGRALVALAVLLLLAAMAWDTRIVTIGAAVQPGVFSPAEFGQAQFPKVQAYVEQHAVDLVTLAEAVGKDPAAAAKQYGVEAGTGTVIPVKFSGIAGKPDSGVYPVDVEGMPKDINVKVQTGPAIMGMDLRDVTGTIAFGQFVNQIEYQNAGSAVNKEMKKQVLAKVDTANLSGKTISVLGAFKLNASRNWVVTPVKLDIK